MNSFFGSFSDEPFHSEKLDSLIQSLNNQAKGKWTYINVENPFLILFGEQVYLDKKAGVAIAISGSPIITHESCNEVSDTTINTLKQIYSLYKKCKSNFVEHLHGDYTVVIIDLNTRQSIIATDRFGRHPLYYSCINNTLIFSSDIENISKHPKLHYSISNIAIYNYLYFYIVPSPLTIYENVFKLQASDIATFTKNNLTITKHWKPKFTEEHIDSNDHLHKTTKGLITKSFDKYSSYESIGTFLSGGLDSSTITGLLSKKRKNLKAFSIGFDEEGYNEIEYARLVAKHFNCQHYEYFITPKDIFDSFTSIASSYSEPFGNSSVIPTYHCAQLAKSEGVNLLLAGDGGDEFFAGNTRYLKQNIFDRYSSIPSPLRNYLIEPFSNLNLPDLRLLKKLQNYIEKAKIELPERLYCYNFLYSASTKEIFNKNFSDSIQGHSPLNSMKERYNEIEKATALNKMMYLDWQFTLTDNDLRKVTGMCSLAGVTVDFPFLNENLVDFSCSIPTDLKIENNQLRAFFKNAMRDFLPQEVISKSKHGFGLPFGLWMKTYAPLKDLVYDNLEQFKSREILEQEFIDQSIRLHNNNHASYYGELLWVISVLNTWLSDREQSRTFDSAVIGYMNVFARFWKL